MTKLLNGQQIINGVSNLVFGTNTPNYDTTLSTSAAVQNQMKAANITVIRAGFTDSSGNKYSDAQLDAQYNAIHNAGAVMLGILPHANASFCQHVVSYLGTRCMLYEYSNEPDISNGFNVNSYAAEWNQVIPLVRAINPNADYIGPVLGVFSNAGAWITGANSWLAQVKAAGNAPDAISVHIYPCTGGSIAQSTCISRAAGIGPNVASLKSGIHTILGYDVPLCLTEWNADAYYNNPPGGSNGGQGYNSNNPANNSFNNTFTVDALEGFVSSGLDMCCHFELDYFLANKNGPTSSAAQYLAFQSETQKYGITGGTSNGGGTPSTTLTASPTSLSLNGVVNGSGSSQATTLTNNGSAGNLSAPITYSDYASLNWISVSTASALGGGGTTASATITCTPVPGLPAGTHTATIAFTLNGQVANVSVTFTVTGGATGPAMHIYAPAYSSPNDPNGSWAQYESAGSAVGFIVANPNSGPGSSQSSVFTNGIAAMHQAGIKVLGYVWTNTGNVSLASVESQIDTWYSWYNVDGIHLDDCLCTSGNYSYYQSLYNYIKAKDAVRNLVYLNPAAVPPENYMQILDTVCVYENTLINLNSNHFTAQPYMANYAATKFSATVQGMTNTATVDGVMNQLRAANIGYVFLTDQSGASPYFAAPNSTVWNETLADLGTVSTGTGGGGTGTTTALELYFAALADTTLPQANQLYTLANPTGTPTSTWSYSRVGTSTGFGQVTAQTQTNAWEALSALSAPDGSGFLYESSALQNNQLIAGNWGATIRLNAAQNGDGADGTGSAGTLVGDLYVRTFKRSSSGTYTPIVTLSLLNQTIPAGRTTYQIPNVATSVATPFAAGDKLYIDIWVNITTNANNSSVQDIRLNRLSTDTTGMTGDNFGTIVTPGYVAQTATSGGTTGTTYTDTFNRANQSGFGTSSDGETWTFAGTGTESIVSNKGVIISTGSDTYAQLGSATLADVDVRSDITIGAIGDNASVTGRYSVTSGNVNCYKLSYTTGSLDIKKCIAGVTTSLTNTPLTLTAGTSYQFHLRLQGTTLYGNVYQTGTAEPNTWMLTITDSSITSAGGFGIRANTTSGSPGIGFDTFSAGAPNTSGTAAITSSLSSLSFSAVQGGATTTAQTTTLTNSGAVSGLWTSNISYAQGSGWLSLGTTTDTLAAGASEQVAFSCNPQGLAPGTYNASVVFTMGASTANIALAFTISQASAAFLSVSPTSLSFTVTR